MTADARRWRRRVTVSYRRVDGSTGWNTLQSDPGQETDGDTRTAGISTAYNPNQAAVLYAFRADDGRIQLQAGTSGTPFDTTVVSEGSPFIACAPISGQNCILVAVEPGKELTPTYGRLRWLRFSWSPITGFSLNSLVTEAWLMHSGDPQVAAYWNGSGYEFVVSYRWQLNYLTYVYLLRKPANTSASFSYWGQLASSSNATTYVASGSTRDLEVFLLTQ